MLNLNRTEIKIIRCVNLDKYSLEADNVAHHPKHEQQIYQMLVTVSTISKNGDQTLDLLVTPFLNSSTLTTKSSCISPCCVGF